MNIAETEVDSIIDARTCGPDSGKKVTYSFTNPYHALCLDKKDILLAELEACERLLKYAEDSDRRIVEKEMADLRMALDLLT